MIEIARILRDAEAARCRAGLGHVGALVVPVRNIGRAARFYQRTFGFRAIRNERGVDRISVLISPCDEIRLVLEDGAPPACPSTPATAARQPCARLRQPWALLVADVEYARARVWELGVRIARASGTPDQVFRRSGGRSLYVFDSEGNELELVEIGTALENAAAPDAARTKGDALGRYA